MAARPVDRMRKILDEQPGIIISEEILQKAEDQHAITLADLHIAETEVDEVTLRIKQLERRHARIGPAVAKADEVKPK